MGELNYFNYFLNRWKFFYCWF